MADPLSVSASIVGLVTIADIVFSRTLHYGKAVSHAKEDCRILSEGVQALSEVLHSLYLRTLRLDTENSNEREPTSYRPQLVESCHRMLLRMKIKLEKRDPTKDHLGKTEATMRKLRWPFSATETKELVEEIERHKSTISLALSADTLSRVEEVLSVQQKVHDDIREIKTSLTGRRTFETQFLSFVSEQEQAKIFDFFGNVDQANRHLASKSLRHPGTGLWLLQADEFQGWIKGDRPRLWLSGIPGAGKTVLASAVVEEVWANHTDSSKALAYFYCDYKDALSQDPVKILGSLAVQLACQNADSFELLQELFQKYNTSTGAGVRPDATTMADVITEMSKTFHDVFIVVDALDECGKNAEEVTRVLSSLEGRCIKIALLSRNESEIRRVLRGFEKIPIAARRSDLSLYVAAEIDKRIKDEKLNLRNLSLKEDIMESLIDGADGM